jgi:hypothetical protein
MQGDDVIHALADRVEAILGTVGKSGLQKSVNLTGFKPSGSVIVSAATATLTLTGTGGLVFVRSSTDISGMTGAGFVITRINNEDTTQGICYESGSGRAELTSQHIIYAPVGATSLTLYVQTFSNPAAGISVNSCRWSVYALGGTPTLT